MIRIALCVAALCALTACDTRKMDIRHVVEAQLKDPSSADFTNDVLYTHPDGSAYLCGLVNARNSFGGYTGYRRFVASSNFALVDDPMSSTVSGAVDNLTRKNCTFQPD